MLFEKDDVKKRLGSLSGGEAARLVFAKLTLQRPNVLVLDEPTNHLDLESIEALVEGLGSYQGTIILVSHDRWFISQLATRIVDIQPGRIVDYQGTYEEYVGFTGDDHLDADRVVLKAKVEKRTKRSGTRGIPSEWEGGSNAARSDAAPTYSAREKQQALERHHEVLHLIEAVESRVAEIEALFSEPSFYKRSASEEVRQLELERTGLVRELSELMLEWEKGEERIRDLGR
jgi:ABC-type multidrug transport system ATPase subunit